ncbi:MAG: hypothetical protein KJ063_22615 [Anaerolineae bacterium]|nr:hypothetical protein [Anaerolineae bacterium]
MTDLYIVVFSLLGILLSLPALLVTINLLLPNVTRLAAARLDHHPYQSFGLGLFITSCFLAFILITANINFGPVRATSFFATLVGMGLGTMGAAAMSRLLGQRLHKIAASTSELTNLVRGAVIYELACLFPLVGWFVFIPVVGVMVMGAAALGLIDRLGQFVRQPRQPVPVQVVVSGEQLAVSREQS